MITKVAPINTLKVGISPQNKYPKIIAKTNAKYLSFSTRIACVPCLSKVAALAGKSFPSLSSLLLLYVVHCQTLKSHHSQPSLLT